MPACLVTGAARRIGAGITRALASHGWTVIAHYNNSADEVEALASELGHSLKPLQADLASDAALSGLVSAAAKLAGEPLRLLVNNASLFEADHADTLDAARWDRHMQVNLKAPTFLARDFAQQMPAQGATGLIVNLLDQKLWNLNPDFFSYTISKVGLRGVTEMMARALAPRVRVCGIAPGIVLPSTYQSQQHFGQVRDLNPLGQGTTVEDICRTLLFLIDSPVITGQTILVDGGQHFSGQSRDVLYAETD